jgi:hypothetical protein
MGINRTKPNSKLQEAIMEKLFIKGHLKPGTNITAKRISEFLVDLSTICKMKFFFGPVVKSPEFYDTETYRRLGGRPPRDINAVIMWSDSGVQMYIFPQKDNWFSLDIYSCKKFDKNKVLDFIYKELEVGNDMHFSTQTANSFTPWAKYQNQKE